MDRPSRRAVLGGVTTTATALLAGCTAGRTESDGHLFVENRTEEQRRIALTVDETGNDGSRPVNGLYRVPESVALQFRSVLEPGATYRLRASQPDARGPERLETLSITPTTCDEGDAAERTDVSVIASPDGPDVIVFECDRTYRFLDELEYVDPSEYLVRTVTGTISTDTST